MGSWLALGLLIVAGVVLFLQHDAAAIAGMDPSEFASMVALLAILIFLSGSLFGGYQGRIARAIRDGLTWAVFGFVSRGRIYLQGSACPGRATHHGRNCAGHTDCHGD